MRIMRSTAKQALIVTPFSVKRFIWRRDPLKGLID
jgi:hypothetical protein